MRERLRQFALTLHPDKTRLIEFGRFAAEDRKKRGLGKPESFDFLGFTHVCARHRRGRFTVKRRRRRDRMRAKLRAIKEALQRRRSQRDRTSWTRMCVLARRWLPNARIIHPWPFARFTVIHPRWEPGARIGHAGFCAGGAR